MLLNRKYLSAGNWPRHKIQKYSSPYCSFRVALLADHPLKNKNKKKRDRPVRKKTAVVGRRCEQRARVFVLCVKKIITTDVGRPSCGAKKKHLLYINLYFIHNRTHYMRVVCTCGRYLYNNSGVR